MAAAASRCVEVFLACAAAVDRSVLVQREHTRDKEFAFQDWFAARLLEAGVRFDPSGRNTYPDFTLVDVPEGYEVKGLAYPGRWNDFDANSRVPTGSHNGRTVFYVFGRYPSAQGDSEYPVLDLVLFHGDFLNAQHEYVHENRSVRGFGSYGDILIRDRKMYVAPTPFGLASGLERQVTLILPESMPVTAGLEPVGQLVRTESQRLIVGYSFDLKRNDIAQTYEANPTAGEIHAFRAYRAARTVGPEVSMHTPRAIVSEPPSGRC